MSEGLTEEEIERIKEIKAMEYSPEKLHAIQEFGIGDYFFIIGETEKEKAEEIKTEHLLYERSIKKGLAHAQRAGELLVEVKSSLKHGEFTDWVFVNCRFSTRTAQNYMRFYKQRKVLGKAQETALLTEGELTMEQALQYLKAERIKRIEKNREAAEIKAIERGAEPFLRQDKAVYRFLNNLKDFSRKIETAEKAFSYGNVSSCWVEQALKKNKELAQRLKEFSEKLEKAKKEV